MSVAHCQAPNDQWVLDLEVQDCCDAVHDTFGTVYLCVTGVIKCLNNVPNCFLNTF